MKSHWDLYKQMKSHWDLYKPKKKNIKVVFTVN